MAKEIVKQLTQDELKDILRSEAVVKENGTTEFTRRGVARLIGKSHPMVGKLLTSIKGGNQLLSEALKSVSGHEVEGGNHVPDFVVSAIIQHYAFKGDTRCQRLTLLTSAAGLRGMVQEVHHWTPVSPTPEQVVQLLTQDKARQWACRFESPFYDQLSRLTGLKARGHLRPKRWARLTKELVYDYLPIGVAAAMRKAKAEQGGWHRLHQYLSDEGIRVLEIHLNLLLTLMQASSSLEVLKESLDNHVSRTYQLRLVGIG